MIFSGVELQMICYDVIAINVHIIGSGLSVISKGWIGDLTKEMLNKTTCELY